MALDVSFGNMTQEEAERLASAAGEIDGVPHEPGSTEPYISRLVDDFIVARGARTVLETGSFKGATSVYIAAALHRLGGGDFYICEIDQGRLLATGARLNKLNYPGVRVISEGSGDVLKFLVTTKARFDVCWVDDHHEKSHVTKELTLLYPKMNPGGLILLHDVFGLCDLQTVVRQFGGYSIDLPRMGPAGGLGIIQVP